MVSSSSGNANSSSSNSGSPSGSSRSANANVDEKLWPALGDAVLRLEDVITTLKKQQANGSNSIGVKSDGGEEEEVEAIDNFNGKDIRSFGAAPHERAAVHMIQVRVAYKSLLRRSEH